MNSIFLLIIVLCISAQHISKKAYNTKVMGGVYSFSAASVLAALIVFIVVSGGTFEMSSKVPLYSIAFALSYSVASIFSLFAVKTGPLSLTSLVGQYSLIVPTFYGLLVLNEQAGLSLIIGIILLLASLLLINFENKKEEKKITLKWGIYVLLSFIGNGACSTVQKIQQIKCNGLYKSEFMIIALVITIAIMILCALLTERKIIVHSLKKGFVLYTVCGLANGLVNLLVLVLSTRMPASVMFPVISAGGIVTTALVSIFVYKEKLSIQQKFGMLLGVSAVVLLNL